MAASDSLTMMARSPRARACGWALLAVFVIFLVYARVRHAGFLWDDDAHITANPTIVGPQGLKEIWTSAAANYFPLTMTSFWIEHAWWGLEPGPYHIVSVLFHAGSALVLWLILLRLKIPGAWLGAMLWAVHPVQVESVAWICELKNTQSGFFYLLAIWFFVRWLQANETPAFHRDYALALVCATAAILSKTSTVMLPVVIGFIAWWLGRRRWREAMWLLPFFAVSIAASGWTIWEQRVHSMASGSDWNQTLVVRFAIAGKAIWCYLEKLFWPRPLIFIYPRWELDGSQLVTWLPLASAAVMAALLWRLRRRMGLAVLFAAAYFVVSLFPVLGFFNVFFFRYAFVSDHFQYLASIGPLVCCGAVIATAAEKFGEAAGTARAIAAALLLGLLGFLSWRQTAIYQNQETLWRDTVARNPGTWIAHMNLGGYLLAVGRPAEAIPSFEAALKLKPDDPLAETDVGTALFQINRPADAVDHLERALKLKPDLAEAHNSLGVALKSLGYVNEALTHFEAAARNNPALGFAHMNLANALMRAGRYREALENFEAVSRAEPSVAIYHVGAARALVALGRPEEALGHFRAAVGLDPRDFDALSGLAALLVQRGQFAEALECGRVALEIRPDSAECHFAVGDALLATGRPADSLGHYEQAIRIRPEYVEAQDHLGTALYQLNRPAEAIPHYRIAAQLQPEVAGHWNNLGAALMQVNQIAEAIEQYEKAVQLQPGYVEARCNLALALEAAGRRAEAIRQCEEVLKLQPDQKQAQGFLKHLQAPPP